MSGRLVFRRAALDRLSSPDQLDRLVAITSPLGWLALAALGLLCAAALVWSLVGDIPTRVAGRGILVSQGGAVIDATTSAAGNLTALHVHAGQRLRKGDLVADLLLPAAGQTLQHASDQVAELKADYARLDTQLTQQVALKHDALERQRASLQEVIVGAQQRAAFYRQTMTMLDEPLARNYVTHQRQQDVRQNWQDAEQEVKRVRSDLARLDVEELDAANHRSDELTAARLRVAEAERHLTELAGQEAVTSRVVAPADGQVIELKASEGTYIAAGAAVASIQTGAAGLDAVLFIPPEHGKKVKPGMTVQIEPATVRREEFGTMIGHVVSIADFPATAEGMEAVLRNADLVHDFSRAGSPYAARIQLATGSDGRYLWSSRDRPEVTISGGTLVTAEITISHQHPLGLILPMVGALAAQAEGAHGEGMRAAPPP